ncbi:hypothetical protein JCM3774_002895 [Rhodotorula dairenensis]
MAAPASPLQPGPGPAAGGEPSTSRTLPHFIRAVEPFGKSGLQGLSGAERIIYLDQFELGTVPSVARMQADGLCPFFARTSTGESTSGVYTVVDGEQGVRRRRRRSARDEGEAAAREEGGSVRRVRKRSRTDDQMEVAAAEMPDPPPAIKQWACASLRSQGVLDGVEAAVFKHDSPRKRRRQRRQDDGEGDSSDSDVASRAETASDLESDPEELLDQLASRLEDTPSSPIPIRQSTRRSSFRSANQGDLPETPDSHPSNGLGALDASSSLPRSSPVAERSPGTDTSLFSSPSPSKAAEKRYEVILPPDAGYDQLCEDFGGDGGGSGDDAEMNMAEDPFGEGVLRGLAAAARLQAWSSRIRSDCEDNLSALTSVASSRAVSPSLEDLAALLSGPNKSASLIARRDPVEDHAAAADPASGATSGREPVAGPSNEGGGTAPSFSTSGRGPVAGPSNEGGAAPLASTAQPAGGRRRGRPRKAAHVQPSEEYDGEDGDVEMETGAEPAITTQRQAWYSRIRSDCEDDLSPLTSAASSRAASPAPVDLGSAASNAGLYARKTPPLDSPAAVGSSDDAAWDSSDDATSDSSDDTTSDYTPLAGPSNARGGSAGASQPAGRKGKGRPRSAALKEFVARAESAAVSPRDRAPAPLYSNKKALVGNSRAYRSAEAAPKPELPGLRISDNYENTKHYMHLLLGDGQVRLISEDGQSLSFNLLSGHAPIKIYFALGTTEVAVGQYVRVRYSPETLQPSLEKSTSRIPESRIRPGHHLLTLEEEAELEWEALSLDCVRDLHRRDLELYICDAIIGLGTFWPKRKHKWLDPRALARCKAMDKTPRLKLVQTSADVEDWKQGNFKVNVEGQKASFSCPFRRDRRHLVAGQSLWRVEARGDDFDLFPREEEGSPLTTLSYILSKEDLIRFRTWGRSVAASLA